MGWLSRSCQCFRHENHTRNVCRMRPVPSARAHHVGNIFLTNGASVYLTYQGQASACTRSSTPFAWVFFSQPLILGLVLSVGTSPDLARPPRYSRPACSQIRGSWSISRPMFCSPSTFLRVSLPRQAILAPAPRPFFRALRDGSCHALRFVTCSS